MPYYFNVGATGQFAKLTNSPVLNPKESVTFEGVCTLLGDGQDPTIIARPAKVNWEPPYVVYRLGFYGSSRIPEFQLLFENDEEVTAIRGEQTLELSKPTHLAGTYDGSQMRLYVNGIVVASTRKTGKLARKEQNLGSGSGNNSLIDNPLPYFRCLTPKAFSKFLACADSRAENKVVGAKSQKQDSAQLRVSPLRKHVNS
jgi:hypothetical protein